MITNYMDVWRDESRGTSIEIDSWMRRDRKQRAPDSEESNTRKYIVVVRRWKEEEEEADEGAQ